MRQPGEPTTDRGGERKSPLPFYWFEMIWGQVIAAAIATAILFVTINIDLFVGRGE